MSNIEYIIYRWLRCLVILYMVTLSVGSESQPNILFIMADDMGWNDVSYHGSDQISTPNIDALASRSVILQQYYSEAICTPARSALLTGKYPMRLGMQGFPLYNSEDRGIPLTEQLLPAYLKDLGYKTHLVGKWHVGMSKDEFLPTNRGYHNHYGMRGGFVDYYTYNKVEQWPDGRNLFGFDFFDNYEPQLTEERYIGDALTDRAIEVIHNHNTSGPLFLHYTTCAPHAGNYGGALQPPLYSLVENKHIANSDRRLYAEVVRHLDYSIGRLVGALADKGILHNTIITFMSDNGAPTVGQYNNWGVNLPLRGKKQTPWEGAVRVPAFMYHPTLKPKVWDELMHITDWMPTLIAAAGGTVDKEIDGINQWPSIVQGKQSKREEVLIAVEDRNTVYGAIRSGDYKLIIGNVSGLSNGYYGEDFMPNKAKPPNYFAELISSEVAKVFESLGFYYDYDKVMETRSATVIKQLDTVKDQVPCEPTPTRGCLYNVKEDPSESHDLWSRDEKISADLTTRLRDLWRGLQSRGPTPLELAADPANFNYIWLPWKDNCSTAEKISKNNKNNAVIQIPNFSNFNNHLNFGVSYSTNIVGCDRVHGLGNIWCILRNIFR